MNRTRVAIGSLMFAALPLAGCYFTHNTTLAHESDEGQVIYRLSEEQAFTITLDAFARILPSQSLFDITGARRGYEAKYRIGWDSYSMLAAPKCAATGLTCLDRARPRCWAALRIGSVSSTPRGARGDRDSRRRHEPARGSIRD